MPVSSHSGLGLVASNKPVLLSPTLETKELDSRGERFLETITANEAAELHLQSIQKGNY